MTIEAFTRGRVLFVHAHPDDETISTGGAIAVLREARAPVTVLTLTRGELGEVIPQELRHLAGTPALAAQRETELAAAMHALGVDDQRFLGAPEARWPGLPARRYTDSGMRWGASGAEPLEHLEPDALCAAPLSEVASDIAAVIADVRPSAVVSYDETGGYGHPDHVRAHQAARLAADVAGVPFLVVDPRPVPGSMALDVSAVGERVHRALSAHRTQLAATGSGFALSNGAPVLVPEVEYYRLLPPASATSALRRRPRVVETVFGSIAALAVGTLMGALGTATHQSSPPLGLVLALVMVASILGALRIIFEGRLLAAVASAGLLATVALLSTPGAGGTVLVPAQTEGYVWTFGPAVIAFVVLAWPNLRGRPARGDRNRRRAQPQR